MIFKRPYAFFIKYFKHINFTLSVLLIYLSYKLNIVHQVINKIYLGKLTNYSNLNSEYLGFKLYLLLFIIGLLIVSILLLLKRKNKPLKDYIFSLLYLIILFVYSFVISNLFFSVSNIIIEQKTLKLYSDISLLIWIPLIYFIVKFMLIAIGFNLKKFNFTKDIMELKQEEKDNEEVELIFNKNSYKYKRSIRKWFREFKYYVLENKFIFIIIFSVIGLITVFYLFSLNLFNKDNVEMKKNFNAGGFNYKVNYVYETKYDLNNKVIDKDNKFVIVGLDVRSIGVSSSINLDRIRLLYEDEYVYPNNYFNKYFYDLGVPYNKEVIKSNEKESYILIFKVPDSYKKNKYILKFYDRIINEDNEYKGSYKVLNIKSKKINNSIQTKEIKLNENTIFDKKLYGNSNLTILDYNIVNSYIYKENNRDVVIKDNDINKSLLVLNYSLLIDEKYNIYNYFKNDIEFFNKYVTIEYNYNGKDKTYKNVNTLRIVDNKAVISVPLLLKDANNIKLIFNFRNMRIVCKLK